jgi:hypothetical protein
VFFVAADRRDGSAAAVCYAEGMADPIVIDPLAQEVLERLQARPQSAEIVLGGYFALQFHAAYRATHDIDAWWRGLPSIATEQALAEVMREVAAAHRLEVRAPRSRPQAVLVPDRRAFAVARSTSPQPLAADPDRNAS